MSRHLLGRNTQRAFQQRPVGARRVAAISWAATFGSGTLTARRRVRPRASDGGEEDDASRVGNLETVAPRTGSACGVRRSIFSGALVVSTKQAIFRPELSGTGLPRLLPRMVGSVSKGDAQQNCPDTCAQ